MKFIYRILKGEFNFIIPVSYMLIGMISAGVIFIVRYTLYMKRKKHFLKNHNKVITDKIYKEV
jgi:hypothetical protein